MSSMRGPWSFAFRYQSDFIAPPITWTYAFDASTPFHSTFEMLFG